MRNLKKLLFVTGLITAPYLMAMYGEESDFSDDGSMALIASPTPAFAPPACMMGLTCTEHEIQIDMRPAQHNQMKADDDSWSLTSNDAISWSSGDEEEDIQNNNNARNDNSARCASNSDSDLGSTI